MEEPQIGCFGKLPIFSDFIRYNASGAEILEMDQWLQKGIQLSKMRLGEKWPMLFENSASRNFLFWSEKSRGFLLGVYVSGRDQSGRHYPFLIFLRLDRASFKVPLSFSPLIYSTFLSRAMDLAEKGWKGEDLKNFISKVTALKAVPDIEFGEAEQFIYRNLHEQTMGTFWNRLLGESGHPLKYALNENLIEILKPFQGIPLRKLALGLKFPLSIQGSDHPVDLYFWIQWVQKMAQESKEEPVLFWRRNSKKEESNMFMLFSPLLAKHFIFIVDPDADEDSWFDLVKSHSRKGEDSGNDHRQPLDRENISLIEFLQLTGGGSHGI